jgi:polysaccharide biosynthesis transport protein
MEENNQVQQSAKPNSTDQNNNLRQYWHVVLERRWLIIATWAACMMAGVIYSYQATPMFRAVAKLQIDPESSGVLNLKDTISYGAKDQDYLQTQYRNLENRSLLAEVIEKLKLDTEDERYKGALDKVADLDDDIKIVPIRLTRHVEVQVVHPSAKQAENIANTLLKIFLRNNLDDKKQKSLQGYNILNQEANAKEVELAALQKDLQKYRTAKGMISLVDEQNIDALTMRDLKSAYEVIRSQSDTALKTAEQAKQAAAEGKELSEIAAIAKDEQVGALRRSINMNNSKLASLKTKYRAKHPKVVQVLTELRADEQKLRDESDRVYKALLDDAQLQKDREAEALRKYKEAEQRVFALGDAKIDYDIKEQKLKRVELIYQTILSKAREFDIGTKDLLQNMKVVDPAIVPLKPVKPNKPLVFIVSIVGGFGIALGLALFVNFLDDSTSSSAEGFRTLRAAVSLTRNADKLRVISVTSTIPSEGKSLVASNLAIVTAQTGLRTLLVDADLRRPSVHKAFQLQSPVGLSAYLAERVNSISEIAHTTEVPNLDVICCGATPSNPSELISSKRMIQFLDEASQRYDRVILDCPPVSAVADPLVVGAMADGVVFVTKFNKIRREHAVRSVQRIQDAGIHIIGLVLNDIDFEGKDSYYYSYHYYQNRYYASHYRSKPTLDTASVKKTSDDKAKSS